MSVRAFDRGLTVLQSFAGGAGERTVAEIAAASGLDRATVRRVVLTCEELGLVERTGSAWRLTPRVLDLGYQALAAHDVADLSMPYLGACAERVGHSVSLGVLEGPVAVFLARAAVRRVMSIDLARGSRVPAHASALGQALLTGLSPDEVRAWAGEHGPLAACTARTATTPDDLVARIDRARERGWALADEDLELGVRSVAAPVADADGRTVAAVTVGVNTDVVDRATLLGSIVPEVVACARTIGADLVRQPSPLRGLGTGSRPLREVATH